MSVMYKERVFFFNLWTGFSEEDIMDLLKSLYFNPSKWRFSATRVIGLQVTCFYKIFIFFPRLLASHKDCLSRRIPRNLTTFFVF